MPLTKSSVRQSVANLKIEITGRHSSKTAMTWGKALEDGLNIFLSRAQKESRPACGNLKASAIEVKKRKHRQAATAIVLNYINQFFPEKGTGWGVVVGPCTVNVPSGFISMRSIKTTRCLPVFVVLP